MNDNITSGNSPHIDAAKNDLRKIASCIERLETAKVDGVSPISDADFSYILSKSLDLFFDICSLYAAEMPTKSMSEQMNQLEHIDQTVAELFSASFITRDIFCVRIPFIPLKKSAIWKSKYAQIFHGPLQKSVVNALPNDFEKFKSAYVIFLNHTDSSQTSTPYYDNDNIAIKSFLDCIVPYVCYDDSVKYIDNVFLTVKDRLNFAEIFIVNRGALYSWTEKYAFVPFCREVLKAENNAENHQFQVSETRLT